MVMVTLPGEAIRLAATAAFNCVALRNVVVNCAPFQLAMAPETKLEPLMVRMKSGPPAGTDDGMRLVMAGPE